jgi:hypothetical protein
MIAQLLIFLKHNIPFYLGNNRQAQCLFVPAALREKNQAGVG